VGAQSENRAQVAIVGGDAQGTETHKKVLGVGERKRGRAPSRMEREDLVAGGA
jgi:hypothetical protein